MSTPDPSAGPGPLVVALAVAAGGAIGAVTRHLVGVAFAGAGGPRWGATFVVNVAGCLAVGVAWRWMQQGGLDPVWRGVLVTGFLGALTTFSAFGLDAAALAAERRPWTAAGYVLVTVVVGLAAVVVGRRLADLIAAAG